MQPWAVAILKYLLCLSAAFSWLFSIWKHSCSRFFSSFDWQLAPAGLLSDLVTIAKLTLIDADWSCWLAVDSRRESPETQTQIWNWLRQRPHRTQVVHCLQTAHRGLWLMRERGQNSCILSCHLITIPCARNATYEISRNCPIRTALTFQCRHQRLYLPQTQNYQRMHISFEYALKMGAEVMFCSS